MGEKDIGGKYLIDRDPEGWIRWLLNDPTLEVLEVLSPEFQFVGRRGDSLLRVRGQAGEFGALAELQRCASAWSGFGGKRIMKN